MHVKGKDLTREAPRSPRVRLGGYSILGRTLDKCRALIGGNIGEYHFDCPLDNMLFSFKAVSGTDFKAEVENGKSDATITEESTRSLLKASSNRHRALIIGALLFAVFLTSVAVFLRLR